MKRIKNEILNEEYFYTRLPNGLAVYLVPKKEYYKTYGILATHFGSLDQEFIPLDGDKFIETPLGVAHFLEHKVFECKDGEDASLIFSEYGNESNAYTTNDSTAYLFYGTDYIKESLEGLLDFVQTPYFTEESVEKEKDIIEQELKMYLDKPQTIAHLGIVKALYEKNLIRNDIGGTVESIKKINIDILNKCYHTFYHPHNMVLALVGDFDPHEMLNVIEKNQESKNFLPFKEIPRKYYPENNIVNKPYVVTNLDVTIPKVTIGLKFGYMNLSEKECFKNSCILDILMSIYFSNTSDLYKDLQQRGIIDNSYNYDYYYEPTYAYLMISSSTTKEEEFITSVRKLLLQLHDIKIDEVAFERCKKVNMASEVTRFNSVKAIATALIDLHMANIELFDAIEISNNIVIDDVKNLQKYFVNEAIAVHVINPMNKKEK